MDEAKQIICMKWGDLYGPEYVNRLYSMARHHLSGDIRFVCLTDCAEGIREEVECYDCPTVSVPMPQQLLGWRKLSLYAESKYLFGLDGDWLYLDLDVVVTGPMDAFFTYQPEKTFVVMQNWSQPGKGIGNTSVFRFRVGVESYLLKNLLTNYDVIFKQYRNSQTYISRNIINLTFWPDDWCVLFKVQCIPRWPVRFWKEPVLPVTAKVVAFPGVPNPHEAVMGVWPVKKWYKKFYKFVRPAGWIQDAWDISE